MKSNFLTRLFFILSLSLISLSAHAAQWYHVEVIVFEQLSTVTDEQWPYMDKINKGSYSPSSNTKLIHPAGVSTLIGSKDKLARSSKYRVHYHQAWNQPIQTKGSAKSVTIDSKNGMVSGNIRLYKSTYLHATVDLWLLENKATATSWSDEFPEGNNVNQVRNPHLKQSQRIRSKKLRFFDHPKLGVLLQITPI